MMDAKRHLFTARARGLRRAATLAEQRLWFHIRSRQIAGVKFRRQVYIGDYIVDFCSFEPKLVIELDGGQHAEQQDADQRRTRFLEKSGYRVIRFWNNEVMENVDGVLWEIEREVGRLREK